MVTLQTWRLENTDANHYKQYTILANSDYVLFFNSRIGNNWVNQSPKGVVSDPLGKARSQHRSKLGNGYDDAWSADVTVPEQWAKDPARYVRELQDFVDSLRKSGARIGVAHGAPTTDVSEEAQTVLGPLLDDCRHLVSKLAVDPDKAINDYPAMVGRYEAVREEMSVVDGYMDTIRLMLAGREASA